MTSDVTPEKSQPTDMSWGQERRLELIDFRLFWDGQINRRELMDHFGISIQQASLDIARYSSLAPQNLEYDKSRKLYKAAKFFDPYFASNTAQQFLSQLTELDTNSSPSSKSLVSWSPPHEILNVPTRNVGSEVVNRVFRAIRTKQDIEIVYQSMHQRGNSPRWIAPHAIAFDGLRWHVRAWCHNRAEYRDFVISRIRSAEELRESKDGLPEDKRWHNFTTVILCPNQSLDRYQQELVESEFSMTNGFLEVSVREALVYYFIKQLQIVLSDETSLRQQPIEWVNEKELRYLIDEVIYRDSTPPTFIQLN